MRRVLVVAIAGALLLAACGDDDSDTETAGSDTPATTVARGQSPATMAGHADGHGDDHAGEASCSPSGTTLSIVASGTKFDKSCLAVPAGQAFTINYENKDRIPHSLVFRKSHSSNENLFPGADVFTGPKTVTLNGTPQQAGTYAYHCTVHPQVMMGTFVVK